MSDAIVTLAEMRSPDYAGSEMLVKMPESMGKNKIKLLTFLSGGGQRLDEHVLAYMPLVGFIAKRTTFRKDGEKETRVGFFLGLVLQDGTILQSTSEVVANTLDSMRTLIGEMPYTDPIWVKFEKVKAKSAGFSHRLTPVEYDDIPEQADIIGEPE